MSVVHLDFSKVFDELFHDILLEEVERYNLGRKTSPKGSLLKSPCQEGEQFHMYPLCLSDIPLHIFINVCSKSYRAYAYQILKERHKIGRENPE